jgi:DNA sulfur modification protein DndD
VILDSVTLENYGIYGGRQKIELTPLDDTRPIILFGGLNGGGKTTLLDAIQLAFYGPKARCAARGKLTYKEFLRAAIHRGADPAEGAMLEIEFRRAIDGQMHHYRLQRAWRLGAKGVEETVEVTADGELDPLLSKHWEEYIENYIPSGIAHLFFFDAEQIKELAEGEQAAELLGTAIHSLLGLDLVDRLETNLVALERRKKLDAKSGDAARRAKEMQDEVERLHQTSETGALEKAALQTATDLLAKALARCRDKFRLEGGELYLRHDYLEAEKLRLAKALQAEEVALRELASGAAPLLLVLPLLTATETQSRRELESRKAEVLMAVLAERDESVLGAVRRQGVPADYLAGLESLLREDRANRQSLLQEPAFLNADDHLATDLRHLQATLLPECAARIRSRLAAVADLREQLARIETELARVPNVDAIARLQRELQSLEVQHAQRQAEVAAHEAKLEVVFRQLETAKVALRRELGEDVDDRIDLETEGRVVKHSAKVRTTLGRFREAIIRKHADRIGRLMLEAFTQLLRKTSLVTALTIDPLTFQIELRGGDGEPLPFDRLSAGERQLLATSLLWGLARASGRPLPTIIDTPLGRLDSSHRRHLLERYFPVASHQVILLSTDEEIDENSLESLEPYISRRYHLQFDESLRSSKVTNGYFWNHEATC